MSVTLTSHAGIGRNTSTTTADKVYIHDEAAYSNPIETRTFLLNCNEIESNKDDDYDQTLGGQDQYTGVLSSMTNLNNFFNRGFEIVLSSQEKSTLLNGGTIYFVIASNENPSNKATFTVNGALKVTGMVSYPVTTDDYTLAVTYDDHVQSKSVKMRQKLDDIRHTSSLFGNSGTQADDIRQYGVETRFRTDGVALSSFRNNQLFFHANSLFPTDQDNQYRLIKHSIMNGSGQPIKSTDEELF